MHKRYLALALSLASCATTDVTPAPQDPSQRLVQVADKLLDEAFTAGRPFVNEGIAKLPPEVQTLAQAAFASLLSALDRATEASIANLSPDDQATATRVLSDLSVVTDALNATLHQPMP
ncbi:MAG: hypothetical protein EOO40_00365 [Deltaproteobacteria bacterium]|nr:MAG: hypothetical protein EOO40_00365 [Deltaproteobacteria bacterium]